MSLQRLDYGSVVDLEDPGEPSTGVPRVSVTPEEASILAALAWNRSTLEIGTGLGVSTRALALAASFMHTVDIDPWVHEHIWPTLPSGISKFVNYEETAKFSERLDLVFIDGDHSYEATLHDIAFADELLGNGVIVVHDATHVPTVAAALDDSWTIIPTYHGLAVKVI